MWLHTRSHYMINHGLCALVRGCGYGDGPVYVSVTLKKTRTGQTIGKLSPQNVKSCPHPCLLPLLRVSGFVSCYEVLVHSLPDSERVLVRRNAIRLKATSHCPILYSFIALTDVM